MSTATPDVASTARAEIEEANAAVRDPDPVRIGILTPLSLPGDPTAGQLVVRGACLGARYVREHDIGNGRQVALALQNDQAGAAEEGMARSSVGGMAKLAIVDGVVAALGQWHLRTTPWVADAAERLGVPMFIENGHSTVTAQGRRTIFRTYFTVAERARLMIDFAVTRGVTRLAVVAADTVFGLSTAQALQDLATERGMEVLRLDFPQDGTDDLLPELRKVRDFRPDLLVNGAVVRTNYLLYRQAVEVGLLPDVPLMVPFGYPMRSADFWRFAGTAGLGTVWPATFYRPSWPGLTGVGRWFTGEYRQRYGSTPPDTALSAFTDVTIIARAMATASPADRDGLIASLEAQSFPTWRGPVRFGRDGEHLHHDAPPICLMQYQRYGQDVDEAAIIWPPESATHPYAGPDELSGNG